MFKNLLLPTDGTVLSERAVLVGVELARLLGGRVSGLHVIPPFQMLTYQAAMLEDTRAAYAHDSLAYAGRQPGERIDERHANRPARCLPQIKGRG